MIYDIDKIASRFTTYIDAPPERFARAREFILEKFRRAGLEISDGRDRDKIKEVSRPPTKLMIWPVENSKINSFFI
jgi:hypothetical protein